jgi:hypothetical protein
MVSAVENIHIALNRQVTSSYHVFNCLLRHHTMMRVTNNRGSCSINTCIISLIISSPLLTLVGTRLVYDRLAITQSKYEEEHASRVKIEKQFKVWYP